MIIIAGALIPIINSTSDTFNSSSILGVIIVIFTALLQLLKAQEFWILYASTLDQLEREYELFLHRVDEYKDDKDDTRNKNFVNKIESLISSKSNKYMFFRQPDKDAKESFINLQPDKDAKESFINLLNEMRAKEQITPDEYTKLSEILEHRL